MDYRTRIYNKYATCYKPKSVSFNKVEAEDWGKAYDHYLRGWIPPDAELAVADLGCGSGCLLHYFAQRNYRDIVGAELSPQQALIAESTGAHVVQQDALTFLSAHPGKFDLITALDLIEHLTKDEVLIFLDNCHSALTGNGKLILQLPNADSIWGYSVYAGDLTHESCFSPIGIQRVLLLCGFSDIEVRETGPIPWGRSVASTCRYVIWRMIRMLLQLWNLSETGHSGSGVFTRVFLVKANRATALVSDE